MLQPFKTRKRSLRIKRIQSTKIKIKLAAS